jgi:D-alanyl-D-alanine carboxypeptidase/D-alanyl-D-alanine carboxypeptidase (penicillin-binding protein 5/6)
VRLLVNHNRMLRYYDGAIGMKTGYTKKSGRCLVSAAERDGVRLIAVTLNAPNDWSDHTSLLDYGFTLRKSVLLCRENEICVTLPVVGGTSNAVTVSNPLALSVSLPTACGEIQQVLELPHFLYASVSEGEMLGRAVFLCDTNGDGSLETIGEAPLTAQSEVKRQKSNRSFWQWLRSLLGF